MPRKNIGTVKEERKLLVKEDDTDYGIVTKRLGGGRFAIKLNLSREVIGRLCGKFRKGANKKNNIVDIGSVILIGYREFDTKIVDIIYVYQPAEIKELKKMKVFDEELEREKDGEDIGYDIEQADEDFDFTDI